LTGTEAKPLAGRRVVVTRAPEQAGELIRQLEEFGAVVLLLPAVTFADPQDAELLDGAIRSLDTFHWLLFTSQNAVKFFAKRRRILGALPRDAAAASSQPLVAAVGPATAEVAVKEGFRVEYVARQFRGVLLAEELGPRLAGKRVLLPRSNLASADLPAALRAHGAEVVDVVAYHTGVPESYDHSVADSIRRGEVDVISFLSPSAFHRLAEEVGPETLRRHSGQVVLAAIGPVTAAAIREAGLPVEIEPREATSSALVAAIAGYFAKRLPSGVKLP